MKHVVSVSLGSSTRNKSNEVQILGDTYKIERVGTDGDLQKFKQKFKELDGNVNAIGIGGADLYVAVGDTKYTFTQIDKITKVAKKSPVLDGSGLKHTLEREAINYIQKNNILDFKKESVLLVAAVDRYGMAQAIDEVCPNVIYGDLIFGLGLPLPVRSYKGVKILAKILLPFITKMPIQWFYPTGKKQEERTPKFPNIFKESTVIAGDWHYIKRYAPDDLTGKTIITQTLRKADIEWLKTTGAKQAIVTTPVIDGETFATNVMESVLVTYLGLNPKDITEKDYLDALNKLDWKPNIINLL